MSVTEWKNAPAEESETLGESTFPHVDSTLTEDGTLTHSSLFRVKKKAPKPNSMAVFAAILVVLTASVLFLILRLGGGTDRPAETAPDAETTLAPDSEDETTAESVSPTDPYRLTGLDSAAVIRENSLYSDYAVLCDLQEGTVVAAKHADERIYPASLTKIMTFLVAYDLLPDRTALLTLTKEIKSSYPEGSRVGIEVGDRLTVEQCMFDMLLESDTDAVLMLALAASGSESAFVDRMNEKAASLGLQNTRFANATGLHDKNHYTTALEMAEIFAAAMKNDLFKTIVTTNPYVTYLKYEKNGALAEYRMTFHNTTFTSRLEKNGISPSFSGGRVVGGKTGFTDEAAYCQAALALTDDGRYYVAILAHALRAVQSAKDTVAVFDMCVPKK